MRVTDVVLLVIMSAGCRSGAPAPISAPRTVPEAAACTEQLAQAGGFDTAMRRPRLGQLEVHASRSQDGFVATIWLTDAGPKVVFSYWPTNGRAADLRTMEISRRIVAECFAGRAAAPAP
jgi:hypothetical protein